MKKLKTVIVIASASRSGSSLLAEMMRRSARFIHLRGECTPMFALNGHSYPATSSDSDELTSAFAPAPELVAGLHADLAREAGHPSDHLVSDQELFNFAVDLASRLTLQWTTLEFELARVEQAMYQTLEHLKRQRGWEAGRFGDPQLFHAVFLSKIRRSYPDVDPFYYDIDRELLAQYHGGLKQRSWPFGPALIEEPPFITIGPWEPVSEATADRALIIKTPSNAYRLGYLRRLFSSASIKILHLVRNPAASINGLFEGWQYPGFFSHCVDTPLNIKGYSDVFEPHGRSWWKFDLPPGWRGWTDLPLEEVCLKQWIAAQTSILNYRVEQKLADDAYLRIPFEQIVCSPGSRIAAVGRIAAWTNAAADEGLRAAAVATMPRVMATGAPRLRRWRARAELVEPLLARPDVQPLMRELSYSNDRASWL